MAEPMSPEERAKVIRDARAWVERSSFSKKGWIDALCLALLAERARAERLAAFVRELFADNERGDWDGADLQELGVRHRVLLEVPVTEPCVPSGEEYEGGCACAEFGFPTTCYRLADHGGETA